MVEDIPQDIKAMILDPSNPEYDADVAKKLETLFKKDPSKKVEKKFSPEAKSIESEESNTYESSVTKYSIKGLIFLDKDSIKFIPRKLLEDPDSKADLEHLLASANPPDVITIYELDLGTGKKHQIRAHLSGIMNTPILFDSKYGYNPQNFVNANVREFFQDLKANILPDYFNQKYGKVDSSSSNFLQAKMEHKVKSNSFSTESSMFFLHARSLEFKFKGDKFNYKAEFSDHFKVLMNMLRLQDKLETF